MFLFLDSVTHLLFKVLKKKQKILEGNVLRNPTI